MKGSVNLNNFIQTESLTQIGVQLLKEEYVNVIVYLKNDELDNLGNVVYKSGFYEVIRVEPTPPATIPTYSFKNVEVGGSLKFKDTLDVTNQDYLFEGHNFKEPDWDEINKFMKDRYVTGGCSGFIRDNKAYRSFDFLYNDTATIIVHNHTCGFNGVAGGIPEITKEVIEKHEDNDLFDMIPFYCLDGVNRSGISASIYMVYREGLPTKQTVDGKREIASSMLVSYILTNLHDISDDDPTLPDAKTGKQKVEAFMAELNVYTPNKPGSEFNTEYHYLVSNGTKSFVIEFVDNVTKVTDISNAPYITNFYLTDYDPDIPTTLNLHCNGVERYNLIKGGAELRDIRYTKVYESIDTDKLFRSDFNGDWTISGVKVDIKRTTPDADAGLVAVLAACKTAYENRQRGDGSWHTQHASVYDFNTHSLKVCTQENYDLWWLPDEEELDIEKYLSRERNDVLNWLSIATSDRMEYLKGLVKTPTAGGDITGTAIRNDAKSDLYNKEIYDLDIFCKVPVIHDGLEYHTYDGIPLFNEVKSIMEEPDSFLAIYPAGVDPEADVTVADQIVKALYSVDAFEAYLKSADFDDTALFVKISKSVYKRFVDGETRLVLYNGNATDYDEIDRANTFRRNEFKSMFKGLELGVDCHIDWDDNDPRYFESDKGIFISSTNGLFKGIIDNDVSIDLNKNEISTGVYDEFNYTATFHCLMEMDMASFDPDKLNLRLMDVTPNKQGKEESADNLSYTKTGIFRKNYGGTQEVEIYNEDDTKSTIADIGYAVESALLNTKVNRNQINNITKDLLNNIIYCPDDTIYFLDERIFVFYQGGKEHGFSSDEYHKLVVTDILPTLSLDVPNLTCLLWKGNIYQNRSGVTKTITVDYVEKDSQNITGEKFYIADWKEPVEYNLYEGEVEVKPDWVQLTIEQYVEAYADYTAAFWDDRSFTANAQVMNHGVLETLFEEANFKIIDATSFHLDTNNKLVIEYEDDTYESHYVYDTTDPTKVIGKAGTGRKIVFNYADDTYTLDFKFPLNKDVQDEAMYCKALSNQSQNWEANDFALTNMPTCNAGQEKIEGITVNKAGEILNYGFVGIGCFQWCQSLETDYVPYQSFRIEDPANPGSYLVDFNEGSITVHFVGEGDEQLIRFEEILNSYWDDLDATQKAAELDKIHKYTLTFKDYKVNAGNIKKAYNGYELAPGWDFVGTDHEIYCDDKECTININMAFTPYDPVTMDCDPYEYTNVPLTGMLRSATLDTSYTSGITAFDVCPAVIKITNDKGDIVLGDNVNNFHWELTYRYMTE